MSNIQFSLNRVTRAVGKFCSFGFAKGRACVSGKTKCAKCGLAENYFLKCGWAKIFKPIALAFVSPSCSSGLCRVTAKWSVELSSSVKFGQDVKGRLFGVTLMVVVSSFRLTGNEQGLAKWRYSVFRQPGATTPDQV